MRADKIKLNEKKKEINREKISLSKTENKKAKIQAESLFECTKRFGQAIVVERVVVQSAVLRMW